eukprot:TRINITY_DN756_c0_g2_i1.p1 TRINITY_DN756_c0_g2~~TRINITY_DN756_c0_g2_i1.p1  ORF type:complete len:175 (+),score=28.09 TRINITY_DN756_c0_g2_i1:362-886(+)
MIWRSTAQTLRKIHLTDVWVERDPFQDCQKDSQQSRAFEIFGPNFRYTFVAPSYQSTKALGSISLSYCWVLTPVQSNSTPFISDPKIQQFPFQLKTPKRTWNFYADTIEERDKWVDVISSYVNTIDAFDFTFPSKSLYKPSPVARSMRYECQGHRTAVFPPKSSISPFASGPPA